MHTINGYLMFLQFLFALPSKLIIPVAIIILLPIYIVYVYMEKKIAREIKQMAAMKEAENTIMKAKLEMQEQTFAHLSKDIHDNLGQKLSLAKFHVMQARLKDQAPTEETELIIGGVIAEMRDLARSLGPDPVIEEGLSHALRHEMKLLDKTGAFKTNLQVEGDEFPLSENQSLMIYRICQEALQNIIKHAGATAITVLLQYMTGKLAVTISDNGKGNQGDSSTGRGLTNMRLRAESLGGSCLIESTTEGSKVLLCVPIKA